jgi:hypothetical protein
LNIFFSKLKKKISPVSVCFTSKSSAGTWQIRGKQIAATRENWVATNKPTDEDIFNCHLLCVVKKTDHRIIQMAKKYKKPIVFDIVDSWAQPEDGLRIDGLFSASHLFKKKWDSIDADGYIFPTLNMERHMGKLVRDRLTIYHHYWPNIKKNPLRKDVLTVGYEGADYLGEWRDKLIEICSRRGLNFVINPAEYTDMDIVVIARGGQHANFLSQNYKSNVKLANAYGSGTPAIVHCNEMSAHDTDCGDVLFFTDFPGSLERQLDKLISSFDLRYSMHQSFLKASRFFSIDKISDDFEIYFKHVLKRHKYDYLF